MGILGGIALLTRPFTATWVPVLGGALAYDLLRRRASPRFMAATLGAYLLPLLGAGLVQLLFNQLRFGAPFSSGYHTAVDGGGFTTPLLEGLRSNLISPERSLFIFAPPLLAALAGVPVFARRHRRLALVIAALTAIYMVGYSKWWAYTGGWCIGPRFLLPAALLLLLPGLALFHDGDGRRWAGLLFFGLTTLVGICWQVALISIEYTSLYTMHQGMQYPILDTVRALSQTRWWELNFFYLNMFGQLPRCWYFLLLALPLSLLAAGAYLGLAHGAVMARMERTKA